VPFPNGPRHDCQACARLAAFRVENRRKLPDGFNAPVPSFGEPDARLAIVGLAPGLNGANRTGRPFTGDFAGDLLYQTLIDFGFAAGVYRARADDGLKLVDCAIVNAVRCVPPQNKPTPAEIGECRGYLASDLKAMGRLKAVVALGRIAHESVLKALGQRALAFPFAHGKEHRIVSGDRALALIDSYHCSRYNTNTGVLTTPMFRAVFEAARARVRA